MNMKYAQQGIGLVEVLISLLLLAVAALGYSALQVQSLGATDESLTRTQAVTLLHSAAEKIRVNGVDNVFNNTVMAQANANVPDPIAAILAYYDLQMDKAIANLAATDCSTNACTAQQMAVNDVIALKTRAAALGVSIGMIPCPGTTAAGGIVRSYCLIAAWNNTTPTVGANAATDCIKNDDSGAYYFKADCIYMEAY